MRRVTDQHHGIDCHSRQDDLEPVILLGVCLVTRHDADGFDKGRRPASIAVEVEKLRADLGRRGGGFDLRCEGGHGWRVDYWGNPIDICRQPRRI